MHVCIWFVCVSTHEHVCVGACVRVCLPCLCFYVDSAGRGAVVCTGSGLCPHSLTCQLVNSGKGSDLPQFPHLQNAGTKSTNFMVLL